MRHWVLYKTAGDAEVVRGEIHSCFSRGTDKEGRTQLAKLMQRIEDRATLRRDVKSLKRGLFEARLTYRGGEYRLFYAERANGLLLVGLHFVSKKSPRVKDAIELARKRLADYDGRV